MDQTTGDNSSAGTELLKASIRRHVGVADSLLTALYYLNSELLRLTTVLQESQPKRVGAITLQLYDCGKKCNGCPHPKWKKWVANKPVILRHGDHFPEDISQLRARWKAIPIANPRRVLRAKQYAEATRETVEKMLILIEQRRDVLETLQKLQRLTNTLEDRHPALTHPRYLEAVKQIREAAVQIVEAV